MKTKFTLATLVVTLFFNVLVYAQGVSINEDGTDPDASAILDVQSTNKGLLVPRMAFYQITDIENPANGLIVFNTTDNKYYAYLEGENAWKEISYGTNNITPFECGGSLVDPRDGKSYTTVEIGTQCWMGQNLNHGTLTTSHVNDGIIQKTCWYNNESYCNDYGALYRWDEMMQWTTTEGAQGVCPDGWHVPSDTEWFVMENHLDGAVNSPTATGWRGSTIGGQLKEVGYTYWNGPNTGATNTSQMSLRGTGWFTGSGYNGLKVWTVMATSTQSGGGAWIREFDYNQQRSYRTVFTKSYYYPVRCLKN